PLPLAFFLSCCVLLRDLPSFPTRRSSDLIEVTTGDGTVAAAGDEVTVHYTGWLYDQDAPDHRGEQFDSSRTRGEPFTFLLGAGRVIRGWDEGVAGMRVGGQRVLMIPPELGYGRKGAGRAIPRSE